MTGCLGIASLPELAAGQSVLERSPDLSGGWVAPPGGLQFDFVHRFTASPSPERKVTSFPTFVLGFGLPHRTMLGFTYSTNSTLVSRYPNEWELGAHALPVSQSAGGPLDLGLEAGYNLAVQGFVGEASAARQMGRLKLLAVARLLEAPAGGSMDVAVGGGTVLRLGRYVALAGDVTSVLQREAGEEVAWSAGLQLGLPHTPHTLSLQATNTIGISLESASRGTGQTLYGFEFTIPITLARYVGKKAPAPADTAATIAAGADGPVTVIHVRNLLYGPDAISVRAGTTVEWVNDDPLAHTVVAADSSFDSGLIEPGKTWRFRFTKPGTYAYSCRPHPFMHGTIKVTAAP